MPQKAVHVCPWAESRSLLVGLMRLSGTWGSLTLGIGASVIIDAGSFRIAVDVDLAGATVRGVAGASGDVPAAGRAIGAVRRAVVEVQRRVGGLPQLALLGGSMRPPTSAGRLTVEVDLSGATSTGPLSCPALLGRTLISGLPNEFGGAVVSGVLGGASRPAVVSIDRGAYHPVQSSREAFSLAGSVLMVVLESDDGDDVEARLRARLAALA